MSTNIMEESSRFSFIFPSYNFGDIPMINNLAIFLTILVPFITLIIWYKKKKNDLYEMFFSHKIKVCRRDYYTDAFLKKRFEQAKREVRIFCVRNIRISEPDVIQSMREFCNKGGQIELFVMDPSLSDEIIEKIMVTLPTEPNSVHEYKQQVSLNEKRIMQMKRDLGVFSNRVRYYEYDMLPTMHFCQFDNKIYLGYQIFDNKDDKSGTVSLGGYCSIISTKSKLGKLILEQIDFLRREKRLREKQI